MKETQESWQPISRSEFDQLLIDELSLCLPEDLEFFESVRVQPRKTKWKRNAELIDEVFVVAEIKNKVIFYDDTEEAFEVATEADGFIDFAGTGQFELRHALRQIQTGGR